MATDKPRFSITVSDDVYQQINDYQHEHRLATQTKAVLAFIEKGLEVIQNEKKPPTQVIEVKEVADSGKDVPGCHDLLSKLSPDEQELVKKYRVLDEHGKEMVDSALEIEYKRYEAEREKLRDVRERASREAAVEITPTVTLPQPYTQVAAAEGAGAFLLDDSYKEVTVVLNKYTQQADVILKVVGRSMEPAVADGDRILVRQQPSVRIGEIGVFILDDEGFLKECATDRLISLNPNIDDVLVGDMQSVECYGKFIKVLDPEWVVER